MPDTIITLVSNNKRHMAKHIYSWSLQLLHGFNDNNPTMFSIPRFLP